MESDKIVLTQFWSSLYTSPFYKNFKQYFYELFKDQLSKYEKIYIYSLTYEKEEIEKHPKCLHVQFSGEPVHRNPDFFDLNIIAAHPSKNIVSHTLAGQHFYIHNLWSRLYEYRQVTEKEKFCCYIVSNAHAIERRMFFDILSHSYKKKIDSCGQFNNNIGYLPPPIDSPEYFKFLSQYKFMICFENSKVPFYLSEKLINAYLGKTIPIYWGAPNVLDYINEKAIIYIRSADIQSYQDAIERIIELDTDPVKYKEVYEQPLFKDGTFPPEMNVYNLREKINRALD